MDSMNAVLSWSGGKECAMALLSLRNEPDIRIEGLLTTTTEEYDRVSMHGVRMALVEKQAESLGIPLIAVAIPKECTHERYAAIMEKEMKDLRSGGITRVVFGDLFLEDVRRYREENLEKAGMKGLFPLWGRETSALAREFVHLGFGAVVTCIDLERLGGHFAGRFVDHAFLDDLPAGIDPCGENGEFHSFVFDGPPFRERVLFTRGKSVRRGRFRFCDILPAGAELD